MKIYAEETASNSHKATAYLPFRLSIRNVYRMVQRNPPKIMSNQLHFRVKSSRDTLCDPLFPGVLIIWRRIVPFTVTRVHERARRIAAHSPIFPPHLFRKYITTPNVCCRGCVRDVTRVQNGLTSCNSLVVIWHSTFPILILVPSGHWRPEFTQPRAHHLGGHLTIPLSSYIRREENRTKISVQKTTFPAASANGPNHSPSFHTFFAPISST